MSCDHTQLAVLGSHAEHWVEQFTPPTFLNLVARSLRLGQSEYFVQFYDDLGEGVVVRCGQNQSEKHVMCFFSLLSAANLDPGSRAKLQSVGDNGDVVVCSARLPSRALLALSVLG